MMAFSTVPATSGAFTRSSPSLRRTVPPSTVGVEPVRAGGTRTGRA